MQIATKEDAANKSTATSLGTSDVLFPTQNAVKTYVDAAASGNSAGLATEITNRTNADDSIKANLASETTRATTAENTLATNLATETTNRIDSEATIKANLNSEISRATNAEATKEDAANKSTATSLGTSDVLFPTQNAVKTYVDAASSGNSAGLASEIINRTNADDSIKANLASETANRIDSETIIKANLNSEVSRAASAENTLSTNLSTETANRIDSEATIKTNLNSEISRATTSENNLSTTKEDAANKSTATSLGTSDVLFPTQNAVKDLCGCGFLRKLCRAGNRNY